MLLTPIIVLAQPPWEYVYGGDFTERGHDVAKVTQCGSGYIAVGYSNSQSNDCCGAALADNDVYVVRTGTNGAAIWERRYNIGPNATNDAAHAVVELADGSGFVIVGVVENAGGVTSDVFLLKIDCQGNLGWVQRYNPGAYDVGLDVVEATLGNGVTTNAGDLIVCGTTQAGGTYNGLLMRTSSTGVVIWNSQLVLGGVAGTSNEVFMAVKEIVGGTGTGDVVAAGAADFGAAPGVQGYTARVNGTTGAIGAAPQGLGLFGGNGTETFNDVIELTVGPNTGNLLFAGFSDSPTNGVTSDIYLVKTAAHPCQLLAEGVIDQTIPHMTPNDMAREVLEVTQAGMFPTQAGFAIGDLALVGYTQYNSGGLTTAEMLLLPVAVGTLAPFTGQVYGDFSEQTTQREEGYALVQETDGFVLCGFSEGNLERDKTRLDPADLYLVRTRSGGESDCEVPYYFSSQDPDWIPTCPTALVVTPTVTVQPQLSATPMTTGVSVCPRTEHDRCALCKPSRAKATTGASDLTLMTRPNPTRAGEPVTLRVVGTMTEDLEVAMYDIAGRLVHSPWALVKSDEPEIVLQTNDLRPGTYSLTVYSGTAVGMARLVLVW